MLIMKLLWLFAIAALFNSIKSAPRKNPLKRQDCGKRFLGSNTPVQVLQLTDHAKRIVGGQVAQPGAWPWQAALFINGRHYCGGSLINKHWIVTGAHCFRQTDNPSNWTARLGEHHLVNKDVLEQRRNIERIILHPKYDNVLGNYKPPDYDIALMKLSTPAKFNTNVFPVCLLPRGKRFPWGKECFITGWGMTTEVKGSNSLVLRQAKVELVSTEVCNRPDSYNGTIHGRALCAGFEMGGVDACQFDSGGPLSCSIGDKYYLTGVVSWGIGCARPNKYGVYADMEDLTEWVENTVAAGRK